MYIFRQLVRYREKVFNPVSELKSFEEELKNDEKVSASLEVLPLIETKAKSLNPSGSGVASFVRKFQLKLKKSPAFAVKVCLIAEPSIALAPIKLLKLPVAEPRKDSIADSGN